MNATERRRLNRERRQRKIIESREDEEFSAKIPGSVMRDAIRASAPKFGWPGCHVVTEVARILGVEPEPGPDAFRRSLWHNIAILGYYDKIHQGERRSAELSDAGKELNDLYDMLQPNRYAPELGMEFVEKLIEERDKHPGRGEWRQWVEAHCVFTYRQARRLITEHEEKTSSSLIRAANAGRLSLAWDQIRDRAEPLVSQIFEAIDSLDPDDRLDAEFALEDFMCRRSLVLEKIKDRVEPLRGEIFEAIDTLDPDEITDAESALKDFIHESFTKRRDERRQKRTEES
jgi:hypothetical protein